MPFVTGADAARATVAVAARFCAWKTATVQSVNSAATAEEYGTSPGHMALMEITPSSTDAAASAILTHSSAATAAVANPRLPAIEGRCVAHFDRVLRRLANATRLTPAGRPAGAGAGAAL